MDTNQQASVGRIVRFTNEHGQNCAAIITWLNTDGSVALHVFAPTQTYDMNARWSATPSPGMWNWDRDGLREEFGEWLEEERRRHTRDQAPEHAPEQAPSASPTTSAA